MHSGARFADRFAIERTAGVGGMGTVYEARDLRDGSTVALKVLREDLGDEAVRFEREARLLARLEHPGIVRYVDHGQTDGGVSWLAMEWLEGEDLASRLDRGRLGAEDTAALGRRVAEALAAAHALGMVHRDVKPSNLFLPDGALDRVKVIDFGIARGAADRHATMTGVAVGTPSYMAPEQARGSRDVDLRADIFSLGAVLFECLAGRPPFEGQHAMAILAKLLLEEAPRLRDRVPEVPAALDSLVARMLAKDPAARPSGGAEVALALEAISAGEAPVKEPTMRGRRAVALTGSEQRLVSVIVSSVRARASPNADTLPAPSGSQTDLGTVRRALDPFGARVEPLADGSFVVALSGSGGATDQAARAARSALALRDALPEGALALATGRGLLDAGVPIGEAIDRAVAQLREWQAIGIEGRTRVVMDPVTAGLLDARFVVEARGDLFELAGERDVLLDAARTLFGKPTPCVGRDRDIAAIESLFAACMDDASARAVLLKGPAGIGKSRLGQEVVRRARDRGDAASIWVARCDAMTAGSPRRLLADLAARAAGIAPGDAIADRRDKLRAHAASRLGPDAAGRVAEFLGELCGAPFPDDGSVQLRAARQDVRLLGDQIRRALEDLLEAELSRGPALVVVEDLHWADPPSVAFLDAVLRQFEERPFMVLGLARPEVRERFPRLWAGRGLHEIVLGELPRRASERLVRHALGEGAAPAVVARVVDQAAGNPFYLEELIRAAAEGHGEAPGTVLAMVQARLEALSPEARRALRAGSVFGEAFWSGAVRALLGGADDAEAEIALVELEERELVRSRESRFPGERELCFRHALVREAAYSMLTPDDLATGHRLAGAWLEQAGERDAVLLAKHFEQGRDRERAAVWYQRAAEQALEANDLESVVARARRAAALGADGETLGAALVSQGEAQLWRGESSAAGPVLEEAMRVLPRGSAVWFRAVMAAGWVALNAADVAHVRAVAAELSGALGPSPSEPALIAASRVATQLYFMGLHEEAAPLGALLAPILADPAAAPVVASHVHELGALWALRDGDLGAAGREFTASAALFEALGDARQASRVRFNAGNVLMYLGLFAEAEAALRGAIAECERLGSQSIVAVGYSTLGFVLGQRGAFDEARALIARCIGDAAAQSDVRNMAMAHVYLALTLLDAGDPDGAEAETGRAAKYAEGTPSTRSLVLAVLARALLARGQHERALGPASEASEILESLGGIEEGEALVRLTHAEALLASGERARAAEAVASAKGQLLARAARIADPAQRRSFLERVPENARTVALAAELSGEVAQSSTM